MSPTFKIDGIEQFPKQAAEVFHNYFLNITENLNIYIAKGNNPLSLLKIVPITEGEIKSIISSLSLKIDLVMMEFQLKYENYVEIKLVSLLLLFLTNL